MSKSNKNAKNEIIRITGPKCFIEELGIRTKEEVEADLKRFKGKSQYKKMSELTYHHIKEKCKGGRADFENGAIFRNINHIWFNGLSQEKQKEINELCQQYKKSCLEHRSFEINCATLVPTSKGITLEKPEPVELEEDDIPEEIKAGAIRLEPNTPEEEKMLVERRKRVWKKFGKEYEPPIKPASIDIKEQNEFHREIIEEMRY